MKIEDYEFSESSLYVIEAHKETIILDTGYDTFELNKEDVIALAKHFDLLEDK